MDKLTVLSTITSHGLLPLFYHDDEEVCVSVLDALFQAGVRAVEFTNRGEAAVQNFAAMKKRVDAEMPGLLLGIGTIKNVEAAEAFIQAGADFLISPGFSQPVAEYVNDRGYTWIPGCMTPSEIIQAEQQGFTHIKIFPGNVLGPAYISAIKDLFPKTAFIVTGGVDTTSDNLKGWFSSGVTAVGMGSKLIDGKLLKEKAYYTITEKTKEVLQIIQPLKTK